MNNKKILIFILLFVMLFFVGCENNKAKEKELTIDFDVTNISIYKEATINKESDYNTYNISEQSEIQNILNNLKNVKYLEGQSSNKTQENEFAFIITLKENYSILVLDEDYFYICNNGFYKQRTIVSGSFEFLNNINFGNKLQEIVINITKEDLELVSLKYNELNINLSSNHYIKELILNTKYYENTNNNENINLLYEFNFSNDKALYIFDNGTVSFTEGDKVYSNAYMIVNKEFDVLKNITEGDVLEFNMDETVDKVVVKNFEDLSANVKEEDIALFVENLNKVKYIKVKEFTQYTIGDFNYKIEIDGQVIGVYNNGLVIVGDTLYNVVEGNFDFLKDIKFNTSSGWLPWI